MNDKTYFIHDATRGSTGGHLIWWRQGHMGYSPALSEAHIFTESEARETVSNANDLIAFPVEIVREAAENDRVEADSLRGHELEQPGLFGEFLKL